MKKNTVFQSKIIYKKIFIILLIGNFYVFLKFFFGNRTIFEYYKIKQQIKKDHINIETLLLKQHKIIKQLDLLTTFKDDSDLMDEILRQKLNLSKKNEKIIIIN